MKKNNTPGMYFIFLLSSLLQACGENKYSPNSPIDLTTEISHLSVSPGAESELVNDIQAPYQQGQILLSSNFNQQYPYNLHLPLIQGTFPYTGCSITAFATLLHYYREKLTFVEGPIYPYKNPHQGSIIFLSGSDLEAFRYLGPQINSFSPIWEKDELAKMVNVLATLNGTSLGLGSSSGSILEEKMARAFGLEFYHKSKFNHGDFTPEIVEKLKEAINEKEIVLADTNGSFAHMFIIDGYKQSEQGDTLFHFNMGWDGSKNGWYNPNLPLTHQRQIGAKIQILSSSSMNLRFLRPCKDSQCNNLENNDKIVGHSIFGTILGQDDVDYYNLGFLSGDLKITTRGYEKGFFYTLLNQNDQVIMEEQFTYGPTTIKEIPPGEYKIRIARHTLARVEKQGVSRFGNDISKEHSYVFSYEPVNPGSGHFQELIPAPENQWVVIPPNMTINSKNQAPVFSKTFSSALGPLKPDDFEIEILNGGELGEVEISLGGRLLIRPNLNTQGEMEIKIKSKGVSEGANTSLLNGVIWKAQVGPELLTSYLEKSQFLMLENIYVEPTENLGQENLKYSILTKGQCQIKGLPWNNIFTFPLKILNLEENQDYLINKIPYLLESPISQFQEIGLEIQNQRASKYIIEEKIVNFFMIEIYCPEMTP